MGRLLLIARLALRDLRYRPGQAVLLLLAITAATATLTLGLALNGVTSRPYLRTQAATNGADVTASVFPSGTHGTRPADLAALTPLASAAGVTAASGPFPVAFATLRADGHAVPVQAEGRDPAPAAVDQPLVTAGTWVRAGEVVLERTFAQAVGVTVGGSVTLDGRPFRVAGLAVTAAVPEYPGVCYYLTCNSPAGQAEESGMGLAWLTAGNARSLATPASPLSYVLNLRLRDPAAATAFASAHGPVAATGPQSPAGPALLAWPQVQAADNDLVSVAQQVLAPGSWIAIALAVASVAVLAGGRMAQQSRRVGRLKAAGGGPSLIAAILLAEHLLIALVASAAGLGIGWLAAPALSSGGTGLLGAPGLPALPPGTVGLVVAVALGVTLAATLVPAARAARTSTVRALAGSVRPPRRRAILLAVSAWLPVPLLVGLRLTARRPRRGVLTAASTAITVMGVVAVMAAHRAAAVVAARSNWFAGLPDPVFGRVSQVMAVLTVVLVALAAVNVVIAGWATAVDARQPSAVTRALGGTRGQVSVGLSLAQVLPAVPGAVLGMPVGVLLFAVANGTGQVLVPPASWLTALFFGTLAAVAALTFVPSLMTARSAVAPLLQAEAS
jgi:predicted lysophospholipase L1 biosynthesis ABC-type transport system permease subunit